MGIKTKVTMSIAVLLENDDKRVWLQLPANKSQFAAALEKIDGVCGNFTIKEYSGRVPSLKAKMLMEKPLSLVNYLAWRLNKLNEDDILKLCAIGESDMRFDTVEQFIEYTYTAEKYMLDVKIMNEKELGQRELDKIDFKILPPNFRKYINFHDLGTGIALKQKGEFTSLGYLTGAKGWDLPPKERHILDFLNLKGYINDDLYGDYSNEFIFPSYKEADNEEA